MSRGDTRARAAVALSGAALLLSACGFTPMYATPGLSSGLASIDVVAPQGRVGFLLHQDLDDALGHDKAAAARFKLDMDITQSRDPRGLTLENVAERYVLGLKIGYRLTDVATGKVVHTGAASSQVSYDAAEAPYAGIAARQDSQERAASDAARRIQLDLAAWMARQRDR